MRPSAQPLVFFCPRRLTVLQLSGPCHALLLQPQQLQGVPPPIAALLGDPSVLKVGGPTPLNPNNQPQSDISKPFNNAETHNLKTRCCVAPQPAWATEGTPQPASQPLHAWLQCSRC
jgi:hypothetical protein